MADADPGDAFRSAPVRSVELVAATHPDALRLTAARRAAYPHWAAGWELDTADEFIIVYDDGLPIAGAAIRHGSDGVSRASRLCVTGGPHAAVGMALLGALERLALEAGSTRLRLDSSAFLADASLPWERHGYVTGPPYDGNADVDVWTERILDAAS